MAGSATATRDRSKEATTRRPRSRGKTSILSMNPVTRVGGALGALIEHDEDQITDAAVAAHSYRGYEKIIVGRDQRDIMPIISRSCGWCGGVHATTASMALEMAYGINPPPMAKALRSIAQCTEAIWVHAAHLAVRGGPDFCAPVVKTTTPRVWKLAQQTSAPGAAIHGYATIADLMEAMTPETGNYWIDTIPAGRRVQEMMAVNYGKWPHPSILSPGSVSMTLTIGTFTDFFTRLYLSVDYVKKVLALWDDLIDFLYEADDRFLTLGERPASFIHAGCWDEVRADNSYASLNETGRQRLASPGVISDGRLVTDNLLDVHRGIEEHIEHSFYDQTGPMVSDPFGESLNPKHPWGKALEPRPASPDARGRYSWSSAPRWRGEVFETTPLGRLWLTAIRTDFPPNDFIEPTGNSIRILVPLNFLPEFIVEWKIPERNNALERFRADAYGIAFAGLCSALALLKGLELTRTGETFRTSKWRLSGDELSGVGLWESGRGMNIHWVQTDKGRVKSYQIVGASTWNASPRDAAGRPGPIEEALIGSPILEEPSDGRLRGIDAMRVVHSFDPCMNCGVH